ncbi:helix-turn-helix domain-containing protein [Nocardia donostiensis]|uniref:Transcriptional regulator n=1 Tax=Nocardia donostiensis TaxID=1538463 RepID=A0A1W0BP68_9NOCA|nr:helix-turn-helix transcriptional regulator [Nocardia donostiensis]ONM47536.1 transcriptional regulator [Nocardia donostiensis]OQS24294.1 transcriptional regulator [Nocardia donostiensis]
MQDNGSTLPRRQLGRYLMDWRTRAGLSQVRAAELLQMGSSSLQRLERGLNGRVKIRDVEAACELYGVPEKLTEAFCGLAQQANVKSWWHEFGDLIPADFDVYMGLEAAAQTFTSYHVELVPGILQTPDYTRVLVRADHPDESDADHERRVRMRQHRQLIITRRRQPTSVDLVLHETVLHRVIGDGKVMAGQLRHLADMSTRENISVRVLPFRAGLPGGAASGQFVILGFGQEQQRGPVEPPVVYIENLAGSLYLEKPDNVRRYHEAHKMFLDAALDDVASRTVLRQVAKGFLP